MKPLGTLAGALQFMPSHLGIAVHSGAAHPTVLARALADAACDLAGRPVYTLLPLGEVPYATGAAMEQLQLHTFLPGASLRKALDAGCLTAQRCSLSSVPEAMASGVFAVGAVLLRTSPPDMQGRLSLGVSVDYMLQAVKSAQVVVVEVDSTLPVTAGESWIHASEVDAWVDAVDGAHTMTAAAVEPVDEAIARHVAALIDDCCVLQLGVGALPDRVLAHVRHLQHLGLHSGILGDGARALIEEGVIDNSRKEVLPGVSVATMALGTRELYDFLDRNAQVELHPCSMTHSAQTLGRLSRLRAINSALQVSLAGEVNAEWGGKRRVSTPGGLPDFARAAASAASGLSIVTLRATDRRGDSTIVPSLSSWQEPSLGARDVDVVVTEFGVAHLRGKSERERRRALAAIAHPSVRDSLRALARE